MSSRRIYAQIDLGAIENNIKVLYSHMQKPTPIMAVIKADGYGHGAVQIARRLEQMDEIFGFATATAEEALEIRESGVKKPVLVLGYVFPEDYGSLIMNDIWLTIFEERSAQILSAVALSLGKTAGIHIKVDTGMSRIGVRCCSESEDIVFSICSLPGIDACGIFTHFPKADEKDITDTLTRLNHFNEFVNNLNTNKGIRFKYIHCANSGSIIQIPETQLSFVRAGIVIYGLWPSDDVPKELNLQSAMSVKSHIVYIKEIKKGASISYGGTFIADSDMRIATIPVGYADGYPRSLSNVGEVIINGEYAPIVGRVCMDQMMVDITNISADVFDEVTILGRDKEKQITAEKLGSISGRFNYELVCDISPRVPRVYIN